MAKQCIYCGQPLPKDDARFCNDCGQPQGAPPVASADPAPIKVKIPPKEFVRDNPAATPQPPFTPERNSGTARPLQPPPVAQQPSRLPKRPVRVSAQEAQVPNEQPGSAFASGSMNPRSPRAQDELPNVAPPQISQTTFEESTMVLPGWQEELALLRQGHMAANISMQPDNNASPEPNPTPWRPQNVPPSMLSQEPTANSGNQVGPHSSEERTRIEEQPQREFRVRVWDQQPSALEVEPTSSFAPEKPDEPIEDLETVMWQQMEPPVPGPQADSQMADANATVIWKDKSSQDDVEDLPTAVLQVPSVVQGRPQLTIERASTPPSKSGALAPPPEKKEEVEDQPTRPVPAHMAAPRTPVPPVAQQSGPRSPLPPVAQPMPSRFSDLPPLENRLGQSGSPMPSGPSSYGQASGFGQSGPSGRPSSPSGPPFNPPSIAPNPMSEPGNLARRSEWSADRSAPTARSQGSMTPPPYTPQPDPAHLAAALEPLPQKKRSGRVWVVSVLLLLLLIGGGSFWYIYYQPFNNPLPQNDQIYQNTTLGFSLHYPLTWRFSDNQARSIVRFMDSSATGQVSLSRTDINGLTLSQYLSQQENQLGLTGTKLAASVTFADSTWQQVQGTVNLSGATYAITLYVTQHNGHFYTLACLTIPSVYAQMERDDFAPLRASFRFL